MTKFEINLSLTEKQAGYLLASVIEFHHALTKASKLPLTDKKIFEKIADVKKIWQDIENQVNIK